MRDFWAILLIAGTGFSYMIGAGTFTGQEIYQFTVSFGYVGLATIVLVSIFHMWFMGYIMDVGMRLKSKDVNDVFKYYCGNYLGVFFIWLVHLFILIVLIVMISGAGATLTEYYGMNDILATLIMALLAVITAIAGLNRLIQILGTAGILMIIIGLFTGGSSFLTNIDGFYQAGEILPTLDVLKAADNWLLAAIAYGSFGLMLSIPFLAKLGQSQSSRKNVLLAGVIGGLLIFLTLTPLYLGLMSNLEATYTKNIPLLALADQISPLFGVVYSIGLLTAIYTSAAGMLFVTSDFFTNAFAQGNKKYRKFFVILIGIVGFFGGLLPFDKLINILYPVVGYMGVIFILGMLYRQFINKGELDSNNIENGNENINRNIN